MSNMEEHAKKNEENMKQMCNLSKNYSKWIEDEIKKSKQELIVSTIGKQDPKRHLQENLEESFSLNLLEILGSSINSKTF
jgi:26S proteasome regulatory subunit N11